MPSPLKSVTTISYGPRPDEYASAAGSAVALAKEHADRVAGAVVVIGYGQVRNAVPVEIRRYHPDRSKANRIGLLRLESAIATAKQHANGVVAFIGYG